MSDFDQAATAATNDFHQKIKQAEHLIGMAAIRLIQAANNGIKASFKYVTKVNGEKTGIMLEQEKNTASPIIYFGSLPEQVVKGHLTVDSAAEMMAAVAGNAIRECETYKELPYDLAKEKVFPQVINTESNRELLDNVPHYEIGDVSVICRCSVGDNASYIITNNNSVAVQMQPEEALEEAIRNVRSDDYEIVPMEAMLGRLMGTDMSPDSETDEHLLYVITNKDSYLGAAGPFISRDVREKIADTIGGDYYLIPSSIHECIALKDDGSVNVEAITNMIHDVNSEYVAPSDRLSDSLFHVGSDLSIHIASQTPMMYQTDKPTLSTGLRM